MNKITNSTKILFGLVILVALLSSLSIFFPQDLIVQISGQDFPAPKPIMGYNSKIKSGKGCTAVVYLPEKG